MFYYTVQTWWHIMEVSRKSTTMFISLLIFNKKPVNLNSKWPSQGVRKVPRAYYACITLKKPVEGVSKYKLMSPYNKLLAIKVRLPKNLRHVHVNKLKTCVWPWLATGPSCHHHSKSQEQNIHYEFCMSELMTVLCVSPPIHAIYCTRICMLHVNHITKQTESRNFSV